MSFFELESSAPPGRDLCACPGAAVGSTPVLIYFMIGGGCPGQKKSEAGKSTCKRIGIETENWDIVQHKNVVSRKVFLSDKLKTYYVFRVSNSY